VLFFGPVIDDFCKQLVARHPASVGRWVLGSIAEAEVPAGGAWQLLDRELSSAPLHADSVVLLPESSTGAILHLEFQTRPDAAIADPDQRRLTGSGCQLLAGLAFPPDVIQRLLAMSILEDSSVYQLIKRKGLEEGRAEGRAQGLDQGRRQEALDLLGRLLLRRCGPLSSGQQEAIAALPLETLEQLGEALLDFSGADDLNRWLAAPKPGP
jgi:predicted transposase YdaD